MLSWLRTILRGWLLEKEEKEIEPYLDCVIGTQRKSRMARLLITGRVGLKLQGRPIDTPNSEMVLVGESQAANRSRFWELLRQFGGGEYVWEDGTPFRPLDL